MSRTMPDVAMPGRNMIEQPDAEFLTEGKNAKRSDSSRSYGRQVRGDIGDSINHRRRHLGERTA